jgi:hypothetical protein
MKVLLLLLASVSVSLAQSEQQAAEANTKQREKWGLTEAQYRLVDKSRRPGGSTYAYWEARKRGPYGNLLERIAGGPRRPVKF